MKKKELYKILTLPLVACIFILIIQLNFCSKIGDSIAGHSSSKKSCNTYLFKDVITPSNYHLNSYKSNHSEERLNKTYLSVDCSITSFSKLILEAGFNSYINSQNKIRHSLNRAQLQVYLC